jgi:hypothetical protein
MAPPVKPGAPALHMAATVDHVWPQRLDPGDMPAVLRAIKAGVWTHGTHGNTMALHARCNYFKGNLPPTGCEIIALMLVNARLEQRGWAKRGLHVILPPAVQSAIQREINARTA